MNDAQYHNLTSMLALILKALAGADLDQAITSARRKMADEALKAYHASIEASEERETGSAYRRIAEIYEEQGKLDQAMKALQKAESILSERKAYRQQADCLTRTTHQGSRQKKPDAAASGEWLIVET